MGDDDEFEPPFESDYEDGCTYAYSIKIVNPSQMKDFHTVDLGTSGVHRSLKSLQKFISENIPDVIKLDLQNVEMGYIEPGHEGEKNLVVHR